MVAGFGSTLSIFYGCAMPAETMTARILRLDTQRENILFLLANEDLLEGQQARFQLLLLSVEVELD